MGVQATGVTLQRKPINLRTSEGMHTKGPMLWCVKLLVRCLWSANLCQTAAQVKSDACLACRACLVPGGSEGSLIRPSAKWAYNIHLPLSHSLCPLSYSPLVTRHSSVISRMLIHMFPQPLTPHTNCVMHTITLLLLTQAMQCHCAGTSMAGQSVRSCKF